MTIAAGCAWTAISNAPWIAITAGAAGTGPGSVTSNVQAYSGTTNRVGTLTIAESTFTVTQTGTTCSFSISPTSQAFAAAGGSGSVTLTTALGCAWSASSDSPWVVISSGASGTGSITTVFSVAANTGAARSAILTVAGQAFTVNQAAPEATACTYVVTPLSITVPWTATVGTITVTTQAGCAWTAATPASWITMSGSGTGSGTTTYTVTENRRSKPRPATITVAGAAVTLTQSRR